jgi:hypothetical protein
MTAFRTFFALLLVLFPVFGAAFAADPEAGAAVQVVRHYYASIDAKKYKAAFLDWEGASSGTNVKGQNYAKFKAGFKQTASVTVAVGMPGEIEGAAGSSYVEIPVTVTSKTTSGKLQKFGGSYTLRKSNLTEEDGATAEQRTWHIYSAKLAKIN